MILVHYDVDEVELFLNCQLLVLSKKDRSK